MRVVAQNLSPEMTLVEKVTMKEIAVCHKKIFFKDACLGVISSVCRLHCHFV